MTGPEHYREAERLLIDSVNVSLSDAGRDHYEASDGASDYDYSYLLAAQVHATLALAAAAAYPAIRDYCGDESSDSREWTKATS